MKTKWVKVVVRTCTPYSCIGIIVLNWLNNVFVAMLSTIYEKINIMYSKGTSGKLRWTKEGNKFTSTNFIIKIYTSKVLN